MYISFSWRLMRMFNQRKIALVQMQSLSSKWKKEDYNKNVRIITIIIPAFSLCALLHTSYTFYEFIWWTMQYNICIKRINIITIIFIDVYLCNDRSLNFWSKLTLFYLLIWMNPVLCVSGYIAFKHALYTHTEKETEKYTPRYNQLKLYIVER